MADDLFNMELRYDAPTSNGGDPQFNGNISEAIWRSAGLDNQSYGYDYDPMNRLEQGIYYNIAKPVENGRYSEVIGGALPGYDLNGNIQNLLRNGKTGEGTFAAMDELHYDYTDSGNRLLFVSDALATQTSEGGFTEVSGGEGSTDYAYDDNGNLIKDENKAVTSIKYNYLNLPDTVRKSATEYIVYTYDATGRKLAQQVSGSEAKATEYVGDLVFEDNALQFVLQPEGRVVADTASSAPDPWEYQYFLKDHLGNTRVVFSENKSMTEYKATLEDDRQQEEMNDFPDYPGFRASLPEFNHTDGGTTYSRSLLLNGGNNSQVGLAKSFAVVPGDVFDLEVFAKFEEPTETSANVDGLLDHLINAFSLGSNTSPLDGAAAYSAFEGLFQTGPLVTGSEWDPTAPKAYLNYILFDENFVMVDFGFDQISAAAEQPIPGTLVSHDYLSLHVKVELKGYLYVYLSNEQPVQTNVYFDDLKIVHYGAVEQVSDYYPFGLTFNSYQRENSLGQKYLYNGKELQNELDLGWLDYGARMYQPDLGRFFTQDRFAEKYYSVNPYQYAANDPFNLVDINGDSIWFSFQYNKKQEIIGVTMNVTGKVMNASDRDVDMGEAMSDISEDISGSFNGTIKVNGKKVSLTTNVKLTQANSMDEVEKSDHLIVLANATGRPGSARGAANQTGGKVMHVDASDYPTNGGLSGLLGWSNTRTAVHEFGHLAGLGHNNGFRNLMKQGTSGDYLGNNQLQKSYDSWDYNLLNRGVNSRIDPMTGQKIPENRLIYPGGQTTIDRVGLYIRLKRLQ